MLTRSSPASSRMRWRASTASAGCPSRPELVDALARHIAESLDNISVPSGEDTGTFDFAAMAAMRGKRLRPGQVVPGW